MVMQFTCSARKVLVPAASDVICSSQATSTSVLHEASAEHIISLSSLFDVQSSSLYRKHKFTVCKMIYSVKPGAIFDNTMNCAYERHRMTKASP